MNGKTFIGCRAINKEWYDNKKTKGTFITLDSKDKLLMDMKKYGTKYFSFQVLEQVEGAEYLSKFLQYIESFNTIEYGYNQGIKITYNKQRRKLGLQELEKIYDEISAAKDGLIPLANKLNLRWTQIRGINEGTMYYDPTLSYPLNDKLPLTPKREIDYPVEMISLTDGRVIKTYSSIQEIKSDLNAQKQYGLIIKLLYILNNNLDEEVFGFKWRYNKSQD